MKQFSEFADGKLKSDSKEGLIKKHLSRKGYNSTEAWNWGSSGYSGYSCSCGCGLTLKDLKEKTSK